MSIALTTRLKESVPNRDGHCYDHCTRHNNSRSRSKPSPPATTFHARFFRELNRSRSSLNGPGIFMKPAEATWTPGVPVEILIVSAADAKQIRTVGVTLTGPPVCLPKDKARILSVSNPARLNVEIEMRCSTPVDLAEWCAPAPVSFPRRPLSPRVFPLLCVVLSYRGL